MSKASLIDSQWVDIVVPPPPESQLLLWWSIGLVLFLILIFSLNLVWRRRPRQRLRRKINFLKNNFNTDINSKHILRQLEKSLCQYCQVTQLSYITVSHTQWPSFRQRLQQACYQHQDCDPQLTDDLIGQAREIFLPSSR